MYHTLKAMDLIDDAIADTKGILQDLSGADRLPVEWKSLVVKCNTIHKLQGKMRSALKALSQVEVEAKGDWKTELGHVMGAVGAFIAHDDDESSSEKLGPVMDAVCDFLQHLVVERDVDIGDKTQAFLAGSRPLSRKRKAAEVDSEATAFEAAVVAQAKTA